MKAEMLLYKLLFISLCLYINALEYDDEVGNSRKHKSVVVLESGNTTSAKVLKLLADPCDYFFITMKLSQG